jgi:anti-anti-sigma factor
MKRHHLKMAVGVTARNDHVARRSAVDETAYTENNHIPAGLDRAASAKARTAGWVHTLVLSGSLDRGSVQELEREIERLCEEGVTGITLDLRGLTYIEAIGVAVIGLRCGLCRRQGYEFALIRGPRSIQRAFDRAGLGELLPFTDGPALEQQALPVRRTVPPQLEPTAAPWPMLARQFKTLAGGGRG